MKTLEIKLPDEIFGVLSFIAKQRDEFVVEAIKEKIEREKKYALLVEGYQATFEEDLTLAKEFEFTNEKTDVQKSRPFGLSKDSFVVPEDFDSPLSEEVLADFEN